MLSLKQYGQRLTEGEVVSERAIASNEEIFAHLTALLGKESHLSHVIQTVITENEHASWLQALRITRVRLESMPMMHPRKPTV